nr:NUDIX hydrolase [Lysobacter sp. GX 14042]
MVEEIVHGRQVLNQPAGHLEPDESLMEAAIREALEETGWDVRLTAFLGAYQWTSPALPERPARHYLRFGFIGEPTHHDPARPLDSGIVRALWLSPDQLRERAGEHRSPLVWEVVADYLAGRRQPLELLRQVD